MKHLRIASDLHLEAFSGRDPVTLALDFVPPDERDAESMLILAGDISSGPTQLAGFLKACMNRFQHVLFVPGNHEYYRHNFGAWCRKMADDLPLLGTNLHFVTDDVRCEVIDGVRFIYGTLWGDGGPTLADRAQVGFYLNDFRLIEKDARVRWTTDDMVELHKAQKQQIREHLETVFEGRTVVVTHHLPSRRLVSDRFWPRDGSDGANGGFASDCDNIICTLEPWLWVHGHTHDTIDMKLWETRIVCNPAGYRGEWCSEHNSYMPNVPGESGAKFIEL